MMMLLLLIFHFNLHDALPFLQVRDRFRAKHYCDRVLAACAAASSSGAGTEADEKVKQHGSSGAGGTPLSTADMELS
jgi:hypothetical protein